MSTTVYPVYYVREGESRLNQRQGWTTNRDIVERCKDWQIDGWVVSEEDGMIGEYNDTIKEKMNTMDDGIVDDGTEKTSAGLKAAFEQRQDAP